MKLRTLVIAITLIAACLLPGSAQTLTASQASVNFGTVAAGQTATQAMTLKNTGSATATISGISFSNPAFSQSGLAVGEPFPAGSGSSFSITFAPTSSSPVTGTIIISTTSGTSLVINVSGNSSSTPTTPSSPTTPTCASKPCVILSCTPSTSANSTSTVTMLRGTNAATPTQLATGLPNNCAYADSSVAAGSSYTYEAVAVVNGQLSAGSNVATVTIPMPVTLTTPAVSVSFSPSTVNAATGFAATVTVSGTSAATGTVTLSSGAFNSSAATLVNGSVTIEIPANTLDVGSISITAAYTPDSASSTVYNPGTGSAAIVITPTAPTALSGTAGQ